MSPPLASWHGIFGLLPAHVALQNSQSGSIAQWRLKTLMCTNTETGNKIK